MKHWIYKMSFTRERKDRLRCNKQIPTYFSVHPLPGDLDIGSQAVCWTSSHFEYSDTATNVSGSRQWVPTFSIWYHFLLQNFWPSVSCTSLKRDNNQTLNICRLMAVLSPFLFIHHLGLVTDLFSTLKTCQSMSKPMPSRLGSQRFT